VHLREEIVRLLREGERLPDLGVRGPHARVFETSNRCVSVWPFTVSRT